jgi:CRP/FNR family cyclic AMP-dependent transcriptional regulator
MSDSRPASDRASAGMLREIGLFGGLDDEVLGVFASELPLEPVDVGTRVVNEGDAAREIFVVIDGELEVLKKAKSGSEVRVAMLGPSSWFGEMSILDVQPRSASVRALAPSRVMRISAENVERLLYRRDLKAYSLFIMNIARELSRRLRVADGILAQLVGSVTDEYVASRSRKGP